MSNKRNIPKLRFENFLDKGEWEDKKLGELTNINSGKDYKNLSDGNIPVYGTGGFMTYVDMPLSTSDSVGIGRKGTINKPYILRHPFWTVDTLFFCTPNKEEVNLDFAHAIFQSVDWLKYNEASGVPSLSKTTIAKIKKYVPKLREQDKIGKFFFNLDKRIEKQQELIEKYKELKKGYLQKLFPKKGKNVPELRFDDFIKCVEWKKVKVSDVFKITRGFVLSKDRMETSEHLYPVYSSQTSNKGIVGYYSEYLFEDSITWTTDGANAGDVNFRKGKFYCTNVCGVLINKDGYSNKCIAEIINAVSRKYVSYVGNPKLMNNVMADISIKVPIEIEEQKKVSILIDNIDCIIDNKNLLKEQLNNQKTFYLSKLLI